MNFAQLMRNFKANRNFITNWIPRFFGLFASGFPVIVKLDLNLPPNH